MVEIIAEIGKNFVTTEEPETERVLLVKAVGLIVAANNAGADVVKFQAHNYEDEVLPGSERYEWTKRNTYSENFWWKIITFCQTLGIEFLCTPMSRGAAEMLDSLGVDRWKIGSGDVTDFVLLDSVRDSGKPVILSSGMSSLEELTSAYRYLAEKVKDVTLLHCVSIYPCPVEKLNLNTIPFLIKTFPEAKIGFSDHSTDIHTGSIAVRLGAEVIEKHFTLDMKAWGPDHKASLEPKEFAKFTKAIRKDETYYTDHMLGIETKFVQPEETPLRAKFRKGLYSAGIKKGKLISRESIYAMRPQENAKPANEYEEVLGTVATKDYDKYESY